MELLGKHILLILGLSGAAIALIASLTKTFTDKPSRRMLALLAVMGFLVLAAQQLLKAAIDAQSATQRKLVEQSRDDILGEIRTTVHRTADLVTAINSRLGETTIGDLGDRLVTVESAEAREAVEVLSFGKGSVQDWSAYAEWVATNRGAPAQQLCLTFDINAAHSYRAGLILAYLVTSPETESKVREILQRHAWETIDDDAFIDEFLLDWRGTGCVLFHDGPSGPVVAYASAREFASEVLLYMRAGRANALERLLNERKTNAADGLSSALLSVHQSIVRASTVDAVVEAMIQKKWSQCLAETGSGRFLVSLERVIRAAT